MRSSHFPLAAIDMGTNSFHLIVANVDRANGRFRILDKEKEIVRLGSDSGDMKYLSQAAMTRGIESLKRFKSIAQAKKAPIIAVATSAVREALNQEEFLYRVKAETNIDVQVASDVEEARLIYLGVLQALPVFDSKILLVDIGGGSTEFLVGKKREIIFNNSLKLGAVRLTQQFFPPGVKASKAIEQCRKFIRGTMIPVTRQLKGMSVDVAVGTSGTITNIANIIRSREKKSTSTLNNFSFTSNDLLSVVRTIIRAKGASKRLDIKGLDPARADIIVAGALILEQLFRELNIKAMTISEYALREGIIFDTIEKQYRRHGIERLHNIRLESIHHLGETLSYERQHAHHVARLALRIFDQTKKLHKLGLQEREFLEAAAILHEVGLFVSHSQHHLHSYYLIRHAELLGYKENEKEMIANIARYHRKGHPKYKHEGFSRLGQEEQNIVTRLASILRIADGLDRTHTSVVSDVQCIRKGNTLSMKLQREGKSSLDMEIWGSERKKDLFEETFKTTVRFVAH